MAHNPYITHISMDPRTIGLHKIAFMFLAAHPKATKLARTRALQLADQYGELLEAVNRPRGREIFNIRIGREKDDQIAREFD